MKNYFVFLTLAISIMFFGFNSCDEHTPKGLPHFDKNEIIKQVEERYDGLVDAAEKDNFKAFEKFFYKNVTGVANGHRLAENEVTSFMFDLARSFYGPKDIYMRMETDDYRAGKMSQSSINPQNKNAGNLITYVEGPLVAYQEFCVNCSPTDTTKGCAAPIPESVMEEILEAEREQGIDNDPNRAYKASASIKTVCVTSVWDYKLGEWVIVRIHISYGYKSEEAYKEDTEPKK